MSNNGDGERQPDDVGADVRAAWAALSGEPAPDAPISPEAENAGLEDAAKPVEGETAEQKQARIDATGRAHDESGKFTSKPAKDAKPAPAAGAAAPGKAPAGAGKTPAQANGKAASNEPLQPRATWSAPAKAAFMAAPRELQEQMLKREEEVETGLKEWQGKAEDYNKLDKIISPHRERWALRGLTPDTAINALLVMEGQLSSDPINGFANVLRFFAKGNELAVVAEIARQNGLQLVQATNQGDQPAKGQNQPAQVDPTVRRLQEQVHQLTSHVTQSQQAAFQNQQTAFRDEVRSFASKPENLYYENVRAEMKVLIDLGDTNGDARPAQERLKDAYDKACWANPEIRGLLLAERAKKDAAEQSSRAAAARHAGGSITGSPGGGRQAPPAQQSHSSSVEADVRAAWASLQH